MSIDRPPQQQPHRAWPQLRRGERGFATELMPPSTALTLRERLADSMERATRFLIKVQGEDGLWEGAVESGVCASARTMLLYERLGVGDKEKIEGFAAFLRQTQRPDGGWAVLEGHDRADLSSSVEAYWALKLAQDSPGAAHMVAARRKIKELGGPLKASWETRLLLAVFGQTSWWALPVIPVEILLLPPLSGLSVERVAPWWQMAAVSLGVLSARKAAFRLPTWAQLDDILPKNAGIFGLGVPGTSSLGPGQSQVWRRVVGGLEAALAVIERVPLKPLRRRALAAAEAWLIERAVEDGPVDFFAQMLGALTLHHLGYTPEHPHLKRILDTMESNQIHDLSLGRWRQQVCSWALHDTLRTGDALRAAMSVKEARTRAAASTGRSATARSGLERAVAGLLQMFYRQPAALLSDTMLTAYGVRMLLGLLQEVPAVSAEVDRALDHMLHSLLATQQASGAWGRCDGLEGGPWLRAHALNALGALCDEGWADTTALVLESLCEASYQGEPCVRRAVSFLLQTQQRDGAWAGRWRGTLYATAQSVAALLIAGESRTSSTLRQAGDFLLRHQNVDGSWGESISASWTQGQFVALGHGSPEQTAWVLRALVKLGSDYWTAAERGARFLLDTQHPAGFWLADTPSALAFQPRTRLRLHLDAVSEPLWALAELYRTSDVPQSARRNA